MSGQLTYDAVGATRTRDSLPPGWRHLSRRRRLGDADLLDRAGDVVLAFGMHRGAGVEVVAAEPLAREGLDLDLTAHLGPLRLRAPTRVIYVISEPDRRGFAYGTLPGHPERGEELFLVERAEGSTYAEVRAFSRPGRWFTRCGGPVAPLLQRRFAQRYLDALARALTQEARES